MTHKDAIKRAGHVLRFDADETARRLNKSVNACLKAKTFSEFANLQADFMLNMILLPIYTEACPYCYVYRQKNVNHNCGGYLYKKEHGDCDNKKSDYSRLREAMRNLRDAINACRMPEEKEK